MSLFRHRLIARLGQEAKKRECTTGDNGFYCRWNKSGCHVIEADDLEEKPHPELPDAPVLPNVREEE